MHKRRTSYGHDIYSLVLNVILGLWSPAIALAYHVLVGLASASIFTWLSLWWLSYALSCIGFSAYLVFEVKHLRRGDLAADKQPAAVIVFGGMCILGMILAIATVRIWASTAILIMQSKELYVVFILLFSAISSLAAVLGLANFLMPHFYLTAFVVAPKEAMLLIVSSIKQLSNPRLWLAGGVLTIILVTISWFMPTVTLFSVQF